MSRLGQGDLVLDRYIVGKVWVQSVSADHAFHPRLELSAGCQLTEVAARQTDAPVSFRIASLRGQLRWESEGGPLIGDLSFPKGIEHLRSTAYPSEQGFTMCCDLSPQVLARLEAERGGAPPVFWMDLAGAWALDEGIEPIRQSPWRFVVPTDMWLSFLAASGFLDLDVIELRRTLKEGGDLQPAVDHLNAARALVSSDPGRAVGLCRLVIEALEAVVKENRGSSVAEHLAACKDERRGEYYGRIISTAKQLAALNHHHFGQDSTFIRPEALALVRVSEALILMLGDLSPRWATGSKEEGEAS